MADRETKPLDWRRWGGLGQAALNGVFGDYLARRGNPLAIEMDFYHQRRPLPLDETLALRSGLVLSNKIVVLLHGLTNLESIWDIKPRQAEAVMEPKPDNYGLRLQRDFGYTPLFLRYNSGLPVQENGLRFSQLMTRLFAVYPLEIDEIILIGFSMGGLVMRSAQKSADLSDAPWLPRLKRCFYIGSPHEGSPFEQMGHRFSALVREFPRDYISQWADWIDGRSEGIRDLREGLDPAPSATPGRGFYPGARHCFISGSVSPKNGSLINKLVGDSLVTQTSAHPRAAPADSRFAHFEGVPHIPLAHCNRVYRQIQQWCEEDASQGSAQPLRQTISLTPVAAPEAAVWRDGRLAAGVVDLLADGYLQTVGAVESMHRAIARDPHEVLARIPIVRPVARVVDETHKGVAGVVYGSLKLGGKLVQGGTRFVAGRWGGKRPDGRRQEDDDPTVDE
ncbi:triacylglycerol lipase [Hahella sp. HN01]|uniref:esterase/lipase family protein n=1 Tax=Hahella sp. HN01 TaxID=2847262 RepID=UPI001C1EE935|nr:hypothetical protein [Hahella sp. HN01]MBU6950401.1 hypothetical protein [Hahella sp. HN01]